MSIEHTKMTDLLQEKNKIISRVFDTNEHSRELILSALDSHVFNDQKIEPYFAPFYSYLLSSAGLGTGIAYASGSAVSLSANAIGYLRASADGSRLASARSEQNVELFNFNNTTGSITFEMTLLTYSGAPQSFYGLEFSPNGNLLYISNVDHANADLYQFNLAAGSQQDILNSQTVIGTMPEKGGALQLAPDGKIYNAQYGTDNNYLGVISNPDIVGVGCNYLPNSFYLAGKVSGAGLPTFFSSIFGVTN